MTNGCDYESAAITSARLERAYSQGLAENTTRRASYCVKINYARRPNCQRTAWQVKPVRFAGLFGLSALPTRSGQCGEADRWGGMDVVAGLSFRAVVWPADDRPAAARTPPVAYAPPGAQRAHEYPPVDTGLPAIAVAEVIAPQVELLKRLRYAYGADQANV